MKDYHNLFPTEADQYDIYQKKGQASAADKSKSSSSGKTGIKDTRLKAASDIDSDDNNSSENEQADVSESEEEEGDRAIHHKEHKKSSHVQNLKSIKKKPLCSSFGMSKQSKNSLISPQKRKLSAHKNSQLKRLKSKTGYRRIDVSQTSPSKVLKNLNIFL